MNSRSNHQQKTRSQQEQYNRYIKRQDYEPTVDESLDFPNSTKQGEELAEPTLKRKRKLNTSERVSDHFQENWLNWLVGSIVLVLLWLMVDSKIGIAEIGVNLGNNKEDLTELKMETNKNEQKNVEQDLFIQENRLKIEGIKDGIGKSSQLLLGPGPQERTKHKQLPKNSGKGP